MQTYSPSKEEKLSRIREAQNPFVEEQRVPKDPHYISQKIVLGILIGAARKDEAGAADAGVIGTRAIIDRSGMSADITVMALNKLWVRGLIDRIGPCGWRLARLPQSSTHRGGLQPDWEGSRRAGGLLQKLPTIIRSFV